ncbi:MAG: hypothetical protein AAGI49_03900, partial [Bacteroidota bacterium]
MRCYAPCLGKSRESSHPVNPDSDKKLDVLSTYNNSVLSHWKILLNTKYELGRYEALSNAWN